MTTPVTPSPTAEEAKKAPQLPSHISNDGREVWDWANKLSKHVHRQDEIRSVSRDLNSIGTRCGDCDKWMKSRQCPAERNVNGRNQGPSCEGRICSVFVLDWSAAKRRDELTAKLQVLKEQA